MTTRKWKLWHLAPWLISIRSRIININYITCECIIHKLQSWMTNFLLWVTIAGYSYTKLVSTLFHDYHMFYSSHYGFNILIWCHTIRNPASRCIDQTRGNGCRIFSATMNVNWLNHWYSGAALLLITLSISVLFCCILVGTKLLERLQDENPVFVSTFHCSQPVNRGQQATARKCWFDFCLSFVIT